MTPDLPTCVLADDNAIIREVLALRVEDTGLVEVIGEACNCPSAVELIEELRPDVAFVDVRIPGGTGLEVVACVRALVLDTRIMVFSASRDVWHAAAEAVITANRRILCGLAWQVAEDAQGVAMRDGRVVLALPYDRSVRALVATCCERTGPLGRRLAIEALDNVLEARPEPAMQQLRDDLGHADDARGVPRRSRGRTQARRGGRSTTSRSSSSSAR